MFSSAAKVYIQEDPPRIMNLFIGSLLNLTCRTVGTPTPEVVWRLNWGHVPAKCTSTSINGVGSLICPDIQVTSNI